MLLSDSKKGFTFKGSFEVYQLEVGGIGYTMFMVPTMIVVSTTIFTIELRAIITISKFHYFYCIYYLPQYSLFYHVYHFLPK